MQALSRNDNLSWDSRLDGATGTIKNRSDIVGDDRPLYTSDRPTVRPTDRPTDQAPSPISMEGKQSCRLIPIHTFVTDLILSSHSICQPGTGTHLSCPYDCVVERGKDVFPRATPAWSSNLPKWNSKILGTVTILCKPLVLPSTHDATAQPAPN